jgi:hypothetical protein
MGLFCMIIVVASIWQRWWWRKNHHQTAEFDHMLTEQALAIQAHHQRRYGQPSDVIQTLVNTSNGLAKNGVKNGVHGKTSRSDATQPDSPIALRSIGKGVR